MGMVKEVKKLVAITGCDTGIGHSLAKRFLSEGYTVLISYLEFNPFKGEKGILAKRMDIRNEKEIAAFARFIGSAVKKGYHLEMLINNAGVALGGPIENTPIRLFRENMEVNYIGLVSLTQKIIPLLAASRGRIIIIGSMAGRIALPFLSPYVSTKFALEGFADALRREMRPLGVKVVLMEPTAVATPIWTKALAQDMSFVERKYLSSVNAFKDEFIRPAMKSMHPDHAARQIYAGATARNPRTRYMITDKRVTNTLIRMVPLKVLDWYANKWFRMDYGKKN